MCPGLSQPRYAPTLLRWHIAKVNQAPAALTFVLFHTMTKEIGNIVCRWKPSHKEMLHVYNEHSKMKEGKRSGQRELTTLNVIFCIKLCRSQNGTDLVASYQGFGLVV